MRMARADKVRRIMLIPIPIEDETYLTVRMVSLLTVLPALVTLNAI